MKKTYPGQSNALTAYCIRAIIVSIVILGSALFLSANASQAISGKSISPVIIKLRGPMLPAMILYKNESRLFCNATAESAIRTFLKGTINKRPGFSKPGLI